MSTDKIEIKTFTEPGDTGVIIGEPNDVYHANDALSNSQVFDLHTEVRSRFGSTVIWKETYIDRTRQKTKRRVYDIGSAIHTLVLEGEAAFNSDFVVLDANFSFSGKDAKLTSARALNAVLIEPIQDDDLIASMAGWKKDEIEAFFAERPSRPILTPAEHELVSMLATRVRHHPDVIDLLSAGYPEVVFRSDADIALGFPVQCRIDWWNPAGCKFSNGQPCAVDLKTVDNLGLVKKAFADHGYYRSYPFYQQVTRAVTGDFAFDDFIFVFVEKTEPYEILVRRPDRESYEKGLDEVTSDLALIASCLSSGVWPAAERDGELTLPGWHK